MRLAADLACALDPVRFAKVLGLAPDPWQAAFLGSRAPQVALNCSRQVGKSTGTAVLGLHTAVYRPRSTTLILSPGLRQSKELLRTILGFFRRLDLAEPPEAENKLALELASGSRILALPGAEATIRGLAAVDLLVIDEASRVPDALYAAVRPMLAVSGGRLVTLSTPFGRRGWWWEVCRPHVQGSGAGASGWEYYEVPATACPRIPATWLAQEARDLGAWWFDQEYRCQFLEAESAAFAEADIAAALAAGVDAWTL